MDGVRSKNRLPLSTEMTQDDGLIAAGVVTPQSDDSQIPSKLPSQTQGTGTEADLPRRPLPGYDKGAAIDTNLLGVEPIGVQAGAKGPKGQKFVCSKCRMKRWIIDSEANCAANLTRFSTCMFCDLRDLSDRQIKKQNALHAAEINKVQEKFERALGDFARKLAVLESGGGNKQPPPQTNIGQKTPVELQNEFDALKTHMFKELNELRSKVENKTPEISSAANDSVIGITASDVGSPEDAGKYIERAYRQVVVGPQRLAGRLTRMVTSGAPLGTPQDRTTLGTVMGMGPKTKTNKKKNKRRNKKKSKNNQNKDQNKNNAHQGEGQDRINMLIGDSLVGRSTGKCFMGLGPNHTCSSFPGAGVKKVTNEVKKLTHAPGNTLILSVGGNDFFRRDRVPCHVPELMKDFNDLLKVARSRTGRCVVVGLIPRASFSKKTYRNAREVNNKLGDLCRSKGLRFVDMWDSFVSRDGLFLRDGIHLSEWGSKLFTVLVTRNLYGPPRKRRPARPVPTAEARRPQTSVPVRKKDDNNNLPDQNIQLDLNNISMMSVVDVTSTPIAVRPTVVEQQKRVRSPTPDVELSLDKARTPGRKRTRAHSAPPESPPSGSSSPPPPSPAGNGDKPE